ncbi:MAG: GDSL-type esterase/lipase family protein [Spirochaetia bacterium]|nr:GDSL-type esterase/lipase family protein [Spirochaetia bacterium]
MNLLLKNSTQGDYENESHNLLFLGNSITEGYRIPLQNSFPFIIQKKIIEAGLKYRIINGGLSGDTTENAYLRLLEYKKNIPHLSCIVIELGLNDIFHEIPLIDIKNNLLKIIRTARNQTSDIKVFLMEMKLLNDFPDESKRNFENLYRSISEEENIPLLPFPMEEIFHNPLLTIGDGLHPNEAGMAAVAENVWNSLSPYFHED